MRHFVTASLFLLSSAPFFQANSATSDHPNQPPVVVKFLDLFDRLRAAQEKKDKDGQPVHEQVSFKLSETEINDYLRYSLKSTPRPGLDSVTIKVFAKDYLSTFTRVDFDAVEQWRAGTIPTVLRPILKGKKSIWIDFRIHADGGADDLHGREGPLRRYGAVDVPGGEADRTPRRPAAGKIRYLQAHTTSIWLDEGLDRRARDSRRQLI